MIKTIKTSLNIRYFLILFLSVSAGLGVFALFSTEQHSVSDKKNYQIAMVVPSMSPVVEEILHGFVETLQGDSSLKVSCRLYDGKGDRTLLRSEAEDIFDSSYDLIFGVGTEPSKILKEVSEKREKQEVPIVFCGVGDPIGIGLVSSLQSSGNNITGVGLAADADYGRSAVRVVRLKKGLQHVLIVYDPTQLGGRAIVIKDKIEKALKEEGLLVKAIEVFKATEIESKVTPFLEGIDAIFMLRDHTTMMGIPHLIKLCRNYGISLLASDLDSVKKGAAMGFGYKEEETGKEVARIALQILRDGKKPTDIPIEPVKLSVKVLINERARKKQNLDIDSIKMFFIKFAHMARGRESLKGRGKEA